MSISAILFDCDGVLVDSEVVGLEDGVQYLNDQGFVMTTDDLIRRFTGMRTDRFQKELADEYGRVLGRAPTDEEFDVMFTGFVQARRANRHLMTEVRGALNLVKQVHGWGKVPLAVASSSAQQFLDDKVERYGFAPFFDGHVYSADHVDHGKPAPDIFLFAATKLGIDPANCLVIEDSPHGVLAGVKAGATVWGFTGGGHCLADHGDRLRQAGAQKVHPDHEKMLEDLADLLNTDRPVAKL